MRFINLKDIPAFQKWLDRESCAYRDGKGEHQVLQVYVAGSWCPLYKSKEHPNHAASHDTGLDNLVTKFNVR